jgi:glycosyltransferase involved in cell wall biosynthesis
VTVNVRLGYCDHMTRISLIIPAYNERKLLPRLLDTVDIARDRFSGGRDAIEVVVADNASTDDTAAIASARGCRVTPVQKRLIAAARNGGARAAEGEILCFVDADMQIHPETFNAICRALEGDKIVAGSTGGRLERWSFGIALTYAAVVPLLVLFCVDTGVVFCRREDFDIVGGYDESRPVGEDVIFLMSLRGLGKKRGQRLVRVTEVKTIVSMRKFDQHGDWHFLRMMPTAMCSVIWPSLGTKIANRFWYADDR